jgi:hypothetical protein
MVSAKELEGNGGLGSTMDAAGFSSRTGFDVGFVDGWFDENEEQTE